MKRTQEQLEEFKISKQPKYETHPDLSKMPIVKLTEIFSFIPFDNIDWYSVKLVCKSFLEASNKAFNPSVDNNHAIQLASEKGLLKSVEKLLSDYRVDPSVNTNNAFQQACKKGHVEIVKLLLLHPLVNPSDLHNYAFLPACHKRHKEIVETLLKDPSEATDWGNAALKAAANRGYTSLLQMLLNDSRSDTGECNKVTLWTAARNGHHGIIRYLLQEGRFNSISELTYALRLAAENGHLEAVIVLLEDEDIDPSVFDIVQKRVYPQVGSLHEAIEIAYKNGTLRLQLENKYLDGL